MTTPTRRLQFYKADVFAAEAFGGNPVAVIPNGEDLSDREFQQIVGWNLPSDSKSRTL